MDKDKTGIEHHPDRKLQPYTVWYSGQVIYFAATEDEASTILKDKEARHYGRPPNRI